MPRIAVPSITAVASVLLALGGCASTLQNSDSFLGLITPYRIDIVQGNAVTKEQVARVRPGMSKSQVSEILGSPLIKDVFHAERWDYLFTLRSQGRAPQRRSVVVLFDGDALKSIDAPELPSEREFIASIGTFRSTASAAALELTDEQRKALPAPRPAEPAPPEAQMPARNYPPLEAP